MNLQESIRKVLREGGYIPSPIMRRISNDDLEEAFDYALETNATSMDNPNSVIFKEKKPSLWVFSKFVIDDMVTLLEQEYFNDDNRIYFSDTEEDDKTYHEKIRQPLLRHYGKRIKEKYYEVMSSNDEEIIQENIRRVLKEKRKLSNFLLRRLEMLDYEVESRLDNTFGGIHWSSGNICLFFKNEVDFFETIMEESIDSMYYNYFSHIDDNSGEWAHEYLDMVDYIRKKYQHKIMKHYDDNCGSGSIPLKESIRRILREEMELNPTERVYDYEEGRDTVPERLPFDIDKLVDSGVVFVTPAIDGDPESETYKEWTEEPHTHLISLYNVENSSEDGWILKAITKRAPTKAFKSNFVDKIYDGKYNQILWSLEKLGINPMDMLIDMNLQESIRRVLREETNVPLSFRRRITDSEIENEFQNALDSIDYSRLHNQFSPIKNISLKTFAKLVIDEMYMNLEKDYFSDEFYSILDDDKIYHEKIRVPLMSYFGDRIKKRYNGNNINESESIRRVLSESINKSDEKRNKLIKKIMDNIIFTEYNHIICGYDVKNDEVFNKPVVNVTFIGGYGTKLWPVTQGIQKMYSDILDEIWNTIYDYINIPVGVTMNTTTKCL